MRKIMQISCLCFVIIACGTNSGRGNKNTVSLDTISSNIQKIDTVMDSLKLTKGFEKFDEARFGHLIKDGEYRGALNDDYHVEILKDEIETYYYLYHDSSYFKLTRAYYPDGNIKHKGLHSNWSGFHKGIWRYFSEQGVLVREVDYDAPFEFTFENVLEFCKEAGIEIEKGYIRQGTGYHNSIYRKSSETECWWKISHIKLIDTAAYIEEIRLDGKTGKVISRREYAYH